MEAPQGEEISIDRLAAIYIKIRDAKSDLKKRQDEEMRKLTEQQDMIATEFKRRAQAQGVDGFKTKAGTVSMTTSIKASCADWDAFGEFLKDKDPVEYLGKSVKAATIRAYMESHDGNLPPGINIFKEVSVSVRRASGV